MRTPAVETYKKIIGLINKGKNQRDIVSELETSYTTIQKAKKWAEKGSEIDKKNKYRYAIEMLLSNNFFPRVWKKAINRYLEGGK